MQRPLTGWGATLALTAGLIATAHAAPPTPRSFGTLAFLPCELGTPDTANTVPGLCASLPVPENPANPASRKITLRIGWLPATAAEPAADPLVFFAGGPGQSATEAAFSVAGALAKVRERRDVLFVDQRGTGGSSPLNCPLADDIDTVMDTDAEHQASLARDCLKGITADVRYYATTEAVADIEAVRLAIGVRQVNLYGVSYGTRAAQEYLRRYPKAVRSVVLDGIVPPELALGSEHAVNLDQTLATVLGRCTAEPACFQAFGDTWQQLFALRDRLRQTPQPVLAADPKSFLRQSGSFGEASLAIVARLFAYSPETVALLPLLIHEATQGRPEPMLAQAALLGKSLGGQIAMGMHLSVTCTEDADRLVEQPGDANRLMGNQMAAIFHAQCSQWPHHPRPADFNSPITSDVPMLLLSGELDPVTPPRYGEQVRVGKSNARHLVNKGQGHMQIGRGCTPKLVASFLDTRDAAGLDAHCLDVLGPTPFFLNFNGAAP